MFVLERPLIQGMIQSTTVISRLFFTILSEGFNKYDEFENSAGADKPDSWGYKRKFRKDPATDLTSR